MAGSFSQPSDKERVAAAEEAKLKQAQALRSRTAFRRHA